MAVVMNLQWDGVTTEQYEQARKVVNWEGDPPPGLELHVAAFSEGGIRVTDVWDSAEAFQSFVDTRLMPGTQQIGIQGEPRVEVHPIHALFAPGFDISL